ncbi:MAG TPA: segregation and condensation protein A [Myxococcales bacterium]|nr:segregation and condensation protein A [Myxococcales bacterium]
MSNNSADNKESRVLSVLKSTLVEVIKDTTTAPEMEHPLSLSTIEMIRESLQLISLREQEIGGVSQARPHYSDEPKPQVVSLESFSKKATNDDSGAH